MVVEGRARHPAHAPAELLELLVGARGPAPVGHVEPGQRSDAVDAVRVAHRLPVGRLEVRPRLHGLADVVVELLGVDLVGQEVAVRVDDAEPAAVVVHVALAVDQAHEGRPEVAEGRGLLLPADHVLLEPGDGPLGGRDRLRDAREDPVPDLVGHLERDAARDDARRVDALAAQPLDDLLAPLAQLDAVPCQLRVLAGDADDVADRRVRVEPEQQVGRREVEEGQGVALDDLAQVDDPPQVRAGGRGLDGHDVVHGLGRGDEVADRADAADAGHDRGHLVDGTTLDDPLEAAELGDVEVGIDNLAPVVELDGDLGVALDPGDGIDGDRLAHRLCSLSARTGRRRPRGFVRTAGRRAGCR